MKKGQIYEGVVERIDFPNKGIVRVGEECCIVKNALPGQKIRFRVNKVRKGKTEARLLEVMEKSPLEVGQTCSHFGMCGGCLYLSLSYEEELRIKEKQVKELLDRVLSSQQILLCQQTSERQQLSESQQTSESQQAPECQQFPDCQKTPWRFEGIKASPREYGYRNKMEFTFGDEYKDGPLALGLHRRDGFYDILTVDDCRIMDEDYRLILRTVRDYFAQKNIPYYHRLRHEGYLRHLLVRKAAFGQGDILVALVTTSGFQAGRNGDADTEAREQQEAMVLEGFKEALLSLETEGLLQGKIKGILHIVNDSLADVVQSDSTHILYGQEVFTEHLLGLEFEISTFSFFQTNSYGAEVLYQTVRDYLSDIGMEGKTVFDLYSGTGTIAQLAAASAGKVIGVEIVEEAVEAARRNAHRNHLDNCNFIAGDVLKVLDDLPEKPDLIILDPPRDGIHPKALSRILSYGVDHIVYISCKITSLTRDLEAFLAQGYRVERAVAVDQFPWTANVETVVALSQRKPDDYIEVDLYLDELDATSAELKATYVEIKDYVLKEFGLKVSSLYISQVKRKCGLEVGPNYNHAKTDSARVPQCPPEKEEAIRAALKHFAMIKE